MNVRDLTEAVKTGNMSAVRSILNAQPGLINMDLSENNEHRAIHFAVLGRDAAMVKVLMEAGADARKGIFPHRDATSAMAIASEREYSDIVALIEEEERLRREELSCPNATVSPVQDQINSAIREGDNSEAIRLIEADPTLIHACDRKGATLLHVAAEEANLKMVAWLIQKRAKVNKRDIQNKTPLDLAALAAHPKFPETAGLLLAHGAELTIFSAVALADTTSIREFLKADPALLRWIEGKGGLLTLAVHHGHVGIVKLLLDLGADPDERIFLEQVEEPTASWGMPLWNAALENRYDICELLLKHGADANANVYASGWPLLNAWNHEDGRVKNLLLDHGAKLQPYMVSETHNVEEAKRLLASNPSEEVTQELLWSAADSGCPAIVELALAQVHWPLDDSRWHWVLIQPVRGATADRTSTDGHFASMEILLRHGIDPNIARYGQTVLHFAAGYRGDVSDEERARFAALLIDFGASLTVRDDLLKSTPLGWACRWGRTKLAALLIARGAPVHEPDAEAWATPSAWAEKSRNTEVISITRSVSLP